MVTPERKLKVHIINFILKKVGQAESQHATRNGGILGLDTRSISHFGKGRTKSRTRNIHENGRVRRKSRLNMNEPIECQVKSMYKRTHDWKLS